MNLCSRRQEIKIVNLLGAYKVVDGGNLNFCSGCGTSILIEAISEEQRSPNLAASGLRSAMSPA